MKKTYWFSLVFFLSVGFLVLLGYWLYVNVYRNNTTQERLLSHITTAWNDQRYDTLIKLSNEYLLVYPDDERVLLLEGFALISIAYLEKQDTIPMDTNKIWHAIHSIRQSLQLNKHTTWNHESYYMLGKAYYILSGEHLTKSVDYLQRAKDAGVRLPDIYDFLAIAWQDLGDYDKAVSVIKEALVVIPRVSLYLALLDVYLEQENIDAVFDTVDDAQSYALDDYANEQVAIRKARAYIFSQRLDEATRILKGIIQENPALADAYYYLGNIFELQGDMVKARYQWRQAYKFAPHWDEVVIKLEIEHDL